MSTASSQPLLKASLWQCATQMTEVTTMLAASASVIGCGVGYAAASAMKVAPQKKLIPAALGIFAAQMLAIKLVSNGGLGPSNRRSAAAMEAWQRRLDVFVRTGADGSGGEGLLLTPLAVITGATCGLGKISAENLAACGWKVVLGCRDLVAAERAKASIIANAQRRLQQRYRGISDEAQRQRVAQLIAAVATNVTVSALDVSDYDSIRAFAEEAVSIEATAGQPTEVPNGLGLRTRHDGLRLLMNNAGLFLPGYRQWSSLGVQTMFNINYAGPAYLTFLITRDIVTPRVQRQQSAGGDVVPFRTVNLGSCANLWALGILNPKTHTEAVGMMRDILAAAGDPTQVPRNNKLLRGMGSDTYGLSKIGMIALAFNTAAKAKADGVGSHVTAFSLHPGGVRTLVFRRVKGINRIFFKIFSRIVFKHERWGASNQTYLSLVLIDEQRETDPLTRSVVAASNGSCATVGSLGRSTVVSAAMASGGFLIDAGEAKPRGAMSCVTNPDVFAEFNSWTESFIQKAESSSSAQQ